MPPVLVWPPMLLVPLELALPPAALTPPSGLLVPPAFEIAGPVVSKEDEEPPLADEIGDIPPTDAPPAADSCPLSELETPQAVSRLQVTIERPEKTVFILAPSRRVRADRAASISNK